jgi:transcriptional regulator with XRE-family HTH domain
LNVNVGGLIRKERLQQQLSLRELARRVGVSASMLSQVETGRARPSVSTIYAIAAELQLSIDALLSDNEGVVTSPVAATGSRRSEEAAVLPETLLASQLIRPEQRRKLELDSGVTWELLSDLLPHLVDFMLVTYEPGGRSSSSGKLTRHSGTEFAFLLRGTLKVQVGFAEYVLRPGDSMAFDSAEPHLLVNEGTEPAVGIWFVLGRRQASEPRAARTPAPDGATVLRYPGSQG